MKVEVKAVESKMKSANQAKRFPLQLPKANIRLRNQTDCDAVKEATEGITRD